MNAQPVEVDGVPGVAWQAEAASGSAFVLPGGSRAGHRLGGIPARPDLHYARSLLLARSLSVLELWWDAEAAPDGEAGERWLLERARAAAAAAAPTPVRAAVGRSWGTRALAKLVVAGEAPAALVWIAPLLGHPEVRAAVTAAAAGSCVLAGTEDPLVEAEALREVEAGGATVVRIDHGNHGLETGRAAEDARALADALDALDAFLRATVATAR